MKPARLAVLLSGSGTTLENIFVHAEDRGLPAEVVVVISSRRDAYGLERARRRGVSTEICRPRDFPDVTAFSDALVKLIDRHKPDLVVQAGFMVHWVLPERYAGKVMNIHPALLPAFGGKGLYGHFVHEAVLARGCKVTGCTVHFVNNVYDDGPIILQQTCPVEEGDTPDALADRVQAEERVAYPEAIRLFAEGRLRVDGRWVRILPKAK